MSKEDILKQGYFDCHICNERHMALIPFVILDNDNVVCECHTCSANADIAENKTRLEDSIFLLVNKFESVYGVAVKSVKLKQHGLDDRLTGVELVVIL